MTSKTGPLPTMANTNFVHFLKWLGFRVGTGKNHGKFNKQNDSKAELKVLDIFGDEKLATPSITILFLHSSLIQRGTLCRNGFYPDIFIDAKLNCTSKV